MGKLCAPYLCTVRKLDEGADIAWQGIRQDDGSWKCAYQGCTSKSVFHRGCDLRKHFKRHTKTLFCRHPGCSQATVGGFSSKKDRARHEASHNPTIVCEWEGCTKLFSRVDNMVRILRIAPCLARADKLIRKTMFAGFTRSERDDHEHDKLSHLIPHISSRPESRCGRWCQDIQAQYCWCPWSILPSPLQ